MKVLLGFELRIGSPSSSRAQLLPSCPYCVGLNKAPEYRQGFVYRFKAGQERHKVASLLHLKLSSSLLFLLQAPPTALLLRQGWANARLNSCCGRRCGAIRCSWLVLSCPE